MNEGSKAFAAGVIRPKAVRTLTWLMAALNPLGYALLWNPHKTKFAAASLFVVFTVMIAAGYVVLWFSGRERIGRGSWYF